MSEPVSQPSFSDRNPTALSERSKRALERRFNKDTRIARSELVASHRSNREIELLMDKQDGLLHLRWRHTEGMDGGWRQICVDETDKGSRSHLILFIVKENGKIFNIGHAFGRDGSIVLQMLDQEFILRTEGEWSGVNVLREGNRLTPKTETVANEKSPKNRSQPPRVMRPRRPQYFEAIRIRPDVRVLSPRRAQALEDQSPDDGVDFTEADLARLRGTVSTESAWLRSA